MIMFGDLLHLKKINSHPIRKESLNSDDQQFHKYQPNEIIFVFDNYIYIIHLFWIESFWWNISYDPRTHVVISIFSFVLKKTRVF